MPKKKVELGLDSRLSESDIAPHIVELIDGRNFLFYPYMKQVSILFDQIDFLEDDVHKLGLDGVFYEKQVGMPFSKVIQTDFTLSLVIKSSKIETSGTGKWMIYIDNELVETIDLNITDGETLYKYSAPILTRNAVVKQVIERPYDLPVTVSERVFINQLYNTQEITAALLHTPFFYVEEIRLKKGDSIILEDTASYFENDTDKDMSYKFNKPIAVRKIKFTSGTPEIMLYFTKMNDIAEAVE